MSKYKIKPVSPDDLKTYPLRSRKSKVNTQNFASALPPNQIFSQFVNSLPDILAGKDFKEFLSLMEQAKKKNKAIIFALGAHVIKVGLSPVLIDLMKRGWVTALAFNGAGIIHDFEVAFSGQTSEDVELQLKDGQFGMAQETAEMLNESINSGREKGLGLGEALGEMISASEFPYKQMSLLGTAYELNIPVTVHVAIGTDTIHFHPKTRGDVLGELTLKDFFLLCAVLEGLEGGGIFINVGSAVVLPEVFLKALSFVRNKGKTPEDFTTAVFDFIHHYRPHHNVVKRPHGKRGKGFYFIGHHELLIPLLAASLKSR
jgi:hypothetical protein